MLVACRNCFFFFFYNTVILMLLMLSNAGLIPMHLFDIFFYVMFLETSNESLLIKVNFCRLQVMHICHPLHMLLPQKEMPQNL